MMLPWLRVLLATLAVYRLAQLVAYDDGPAHVFRRIREAAGRRAAAGSYLWHNVATWLHCPYCSGVWLAVLAALGVQWYSVAGDVLLLWWGIAGAQAILENVSVRRE